MSEELLLTEKDIKEGDAIEISAGHTEIVITPLYLFRLAKEYGLFEAQLAKVLKHRLDRPELREKVAEYIWKFTRKRTKAPKWVSLEEFQREIIRKQADQILAFIPDEKEIRKDERERIFNKVVPPFKSSPEVDAKGEEYRWAVECGYNLARALINQEILAEQALGEK